MTSNTAARLEKVQFYFYAFLGATLPVAMFFAPRSMPVFLLLLTLFILIFQRDNAKFSKYFLIVVLIPGSYLLLSNFWSIIPEISLIKTLKIIAIGACACALFHYGSNISSQNLKILKRSLVAGLFLVALGAAAISLGKTIDFFSPAFLPHNRFKSGSGLLLITCFLLILSSLKTRKKTALLFFLLLIPVALAPIPPKAVLIGLVAGVLSAVLIYFQPRIIPGLLIAFFCVLIVFSPIFLTADNLLILLNFTDDLSFSFLHRIAIWNFAIEKIAESPIIGSGLSVSAHIEGGKNAINAASLPPAYFELPVWTDFFQPNLFKIESMPLHPHNMGLQIYLELGLIGIILFCAAIFIAFNYSRKSNNSLLAIAFVVLLVTNQGSFNIWQSWWLSYQILLIFFIGIFTAQPPSARRDSR